MPSRIPEGGQRGWIIPIGGAEEKEDAPQILSRFVELCGGDEADIVVIPSASQLRETGPRYVRLFRELGARAVESIDFDTRRDAEEPGRLARLREATGIFLTGGNQLRLTTLLGGTQVSRMIRTRNAEGVHVAGTSAGAAVLSEHMIAFGEEGGSPRAGSVRLAPGFGLTNRFIIDQHFRQRDRLGRLTTAWTKTPPPSSARTTISKWSAAVASPWSTHTGCSSPRWTRSTKASRCACWACRFTY
jgi:cyanophycinase